MAGLLSGGVAIIHEYLDYGTWSMAPRTPAMEAFRDYVIADWRKSGGEPDVARLFPELLPKAGLKIDATWRRLRTSQARANRPTAARASNCTATAGHRPISFAGWTTLPVSSFTGLL